MAQNIVFILLSMNYFWLLVQIDCVGDGGSSCLHFVLAVVFVLPVRLTVVVELTCLSFGFAYEYASVLCFRE